MGSGNYRTHRSTKSPSMSFNTNDNTWDQPRLECVYKQVPVETKLCVMPAVPIAVSSDF